MATVLSNLLDQDGNRFAIGVGTIFNYNAQQRCLRVLRANGERLFKDGRDDKMRASFLTNDQAFTDLILILGRVLGFNMIRIPDTGYGPAFQIVELQAGSVNPDLSERSPETH